MEEVIVDHEVIAEERGLGQNRCRFPGSVKRSLKEAHLVFHVLEQTTDCSRQDSVR